MGRAPTCCWRLAGRGGRAGGEERRHWEQLGRPPPRVALPTYLLSGYRIGRTRCSAPRCP